MKVLVTGAKGFVGKNLVCALKNVQEGKDRTRGDLQIEQIWEYDLDTPASVLDEACAEEIIARDLKIAPVIVRTPAKTPFSKRRFSTKSA